MNANRVFHCLTRTCRPSWTRHFQKISTRPNSIRYGTHVNYFSTADAPPAEEAAGERLAKMIAKTGICGRREAEKRIKEERVTLNGKIVTDISQRMLHTDEVWLDEHKIEWNRVYEKLRLWAVNKPREELVAESDRTKNRKLLLDRLQPLIKEVGEIKPVNHLDYNTDGLVLYANNGRFARLLGSPETGLTRVYKVKVHGLLTESKLDGLKRGLVINGIKYSSMHAHVDKKLSTNAWMSVRCTDIKARQLPICLKALHLRANSITSTEFGPYKLGKIPLGGYTEVDVTPQLERIYYAATRKDGGLKSRKAATPKKVPAAISTGENVPGDDVLSLTDPDLDSIFLDNSGGTISHTSLSASPDATLGSEERKMKKKSGSVVNRARSDEEELLHKLNFHLKKKRKDSTIE